MRITTKINHLNFRCTECETYEEGLKIAGKLRLTCLQGQYKNAIGLAHNQIAGNKRVYVVKTKKGFRSYINPSIVDKSSKTYETTEGCMSYPNKPSKVERHEWVVVKHLTTDGYVESRFEGFEATIHQHEIQHLDGIDIHHQPIGESQGE